jgi:hypothetical protein
MHLAEIAFHVAPGAHAVLVLDQAGWHASAAFEVPANITLLPLPPKCPELNPVENIWQFMRDNWLSNRIFKSYDDIVDHCCGTWNKLVDQPWRIMAIGLRQWAHSMGLGITPLPGSAIMSFRFSAIAAPAKAPVAISSGSRRTCWRARDQSPEQESSPDALGNGHSEHG